MTTRMTRYLLFTILTLVVCLFVGCGGSSTMDSSLADNSAEKTDKTSSSINGDFSFVSPTPADQSAFTGVFTFNTQVSCTGLSGGTSYYMLYVLYEADDSCSYYTYNVNATSFPQTIPLPHDYFNWVTLEATLYGYNTVDGLVTLDVETRDYFVNTWCY